MTVSNADDRAPGTAITAPTWRPAGSWSREQIEEPGHVPPAPPASKPDRIRRLEDELGELRQRLNDAISLGIPADSTGSLPMQPLPEIECSECTEGYTLAPGDDIFGAQYPTLKWSGFLQLDSGWVYQDDANAETVGDIDSKVGLRRVRLRVSGEIRHDSSYVVDLDFAASGHPSFRDVALMLHNIPTLQNLRFGYFQQPFGMDAMTSGRELLFLERPLPFAFAPFRQTGIGAYGTFADDRGTWSTSTYMFPTDEFGVFDSGSGGHALAARITLLPVDQGNDHLIHVGFDYSMGDPGDNIVRYAIEPGFFVTDPGTHSRDRTVPTIVDTGEISTHFYNLFNAEIGAGYGPFHFQSEARLAAVNQVGGPLLYFPGYYFTAGYALTGESRPYNRKEGVFQRTIPDRDFELGQGGGAYEIVAGWGYIDLNHHNIEGGRASTLDLGLNWYLNAHVKMSLNTSAITLDDPTEGRSHAWIASSRIQAEF